MQSTLRTRLAATLLLSPIAALMVQPAHAEANAIPGRIGFSTPTTAVAIAPLSMIERFVVRAGRIEPGRELRFSLIGAPGARVTLDIPGVTSDVQMREARPGFYEAEYTVRRRDDPAAFARTVATLQRGPQRVTAQVDMHGGGHGGPHDERAPLISDMTPAQGERVGEWRRTQIFARLSDDMSGVDAATVRLRVDGRDVTEFARVSAEEVQYREALGDGRHTAEITVRDRAGNVARRSWTFDIRERDHRDGRDGDRREGDGWGRRG
ncbi:Ig-like domain-containing protein [Ramlibacter sp.]|uniref:Ig-like domain-containing protein n=1 Tax=Ramlibacter sp. TaxID=1917967 RepID=UPI0017E5C120|nr:Ig-like domain-containing protein [Ramlibacter sp.]MBA2672056.1 hypothetical protein [Ramlibacter sp.]